MGDAALYFPKFWRGLGLSFALRFFPGTMIEAIVKILSQGRTRRSVYSLHLNCTTNNDVTDACHYQEAYDHPSPICSDSIGPKLCYDLGRGPWLAVT